MTNCPKIILKALFIVLFFSVQLYAQQWNQNYYVKHFGAEEGLSHTTINCFHQDARGYMWIGTIDGLNRFDGKNMKVYQANSSDSNAIVNGRINVIIEHQQKLWIGTSEGISMFDYSINRFQTYQSPDGFNRVKDLVYDSLNNRIWMAASDGGLKYLDMDSDSIESLESEIIRDAVPNKLVLINGTLYIGTIHHGVYKMDINTMKIHEFFNSNSDKFHLISDKILVLKQYDNGLFIGTEGGGFAVHHFADSTTTYRTKDRNNESKFVVTSLAKYSDHTIIVGSLNGAYVYNEDFEMIHYERHISDTGPSLSANVLRALYLDKNQDLWVGTRQKGVDFLGRESLDFNLINAQNSNLSGNNITAFARDEKEGIWIGTLENGLNYYRNGKFTIYKPEDKSHYINSNTINDVYTDKKGDVWASTLEGGLSVLKNGKFKSIDDNGRITPKEILQMSEDNKGNLWLATTKGLDSYNVQTGTITHHFLDKENKIINKRRNIRSVFAGTSGNIYIGTSLGLYVYHEDSAEVQFYNHDIKDSTSLSNNVVIKIYEDSKNRIWLGTLGGGLIYFNEQEGTFKNYNMLHGFPDNSVKSIEEDADLNLWISTNNGLVRFNPDTKETLIFGESYGLQNLQFNINASAMCEDGNLVFGGIGGFNVFDSEGINMRRTKLQVVLTGLQLFGHDVQAMDKSGILTKDISLTDELVIPYDNARHFSFSFITMRFSNPNHIQYAYKLMGFENAWNYIGEVNNVSFTNLEPKKYTLQIMASDDGRWNNPIKTIEISIPPPWYMQLVFRLLIMALIMAMIGAVFIYRGYAHKKQEQILKAMVEEKNREITIQNKELRSVNENLHAQNLAVLEQKEVIDSQNKILTTFSNELKTSNDSLEKRVELRTKELHDTNNKLNKTVKELDRFVYSASHDLSAPLKSILGLVNIAKIDNTNDNLKIHLEYIENSIKKQEEVIKSLIQYSRNTRQEVELVSLSLNDLVDDTIKELKYMPGAEHLHYMVELESDITISTDTQRIKMILNNLISNAIKYRNPESASPYMKISYARTEHSWLLKIEDNGLGIASDQHQKIFEMFHRATATSDGSGLGLFIVKEAVERLNGTMVLESRLRQGSTFTISFPFV